MESRRMRLADVVENKGQVPGLPSNPRQWKKAELENLKKSLKDTPELFDARGIIVYPFEGKYVVLGGNMRLSAARALNMKDVPCIVIPEGTDAEKLKEIVIKDNGAFGAWDFDMLANEWDDLPLTEWGVPAWEGEEISVPDEDREDADYGKAKITFEFSAVEFDFVSGRLADINANKETALLSLLGYEEDSTIS